MRPDSLQFQSSLWKHIEDLLGKDCGPNRKSRKVGLEIINVEAQIIMPSCTPGSQPWIYNFTAFSLPSIGSESPGFSKERLMMRGCASISRQATLLRLLILTQFFCQNQHLRETMKVSNLKRFWNLRNFTWDYKAKVKTFSAHCKPLCFQNLVTSFSLPSQFFKSNFLPFLDVPKGECILPPWFLKHCWTVESNVNENRSENKI